MSDTTEEKSLPASDKKVGDARSKGQVAKSRDLVTGFTLLAASVYVVWAGATTSAQVEALLALMAERAYSEPFAEVLPAALALAGRILLGLALPLMGITLVAVILTNIASMRGFLFSVTPVTPNFKHINPIEGLKRIYSMRSLVEFFKSVIKIGALSAAFVLVFRVHLQDLMLLSTCSASCQFGVFAAMAKPLMATALIAFILVGLADLLIQQWLFRRDMRMTRGEAKRERRDAEGDPTILRQRRRQREEMRHGGGPAIGRENLLIGVPGAWAVGIRYVRGETPVPVIVSRLAPEETAAGIARAQSDGIAIAADEPLAEMLARTGRVGEPVPRHMFQAVADRLVAAGQI